MVLLAISCKVRGGELENYKEEPRADYVSGNVPGITKEELREVLLEVFKAGEEPGSVSGNGITDEPVPESVSGNGADAGTVSGNGNSVSDNSVSYNGILTDIYTEVQTLQKEELPIWDKPLEDYTVTEGLLLLMFFLLLALFLGKFFKKGERYV